jgi:L-asparaginase / beta-aspartyl-peptidase
LGLDQPTILSNGLARKAKDIIEKVAERDAHLPAYPVPTFRKIVKSLLRDVGNRVDGQNMEKLIQALHSLDAPLNESFNRAAAGLRSGAAGPNWATACFKDCLLSLRTPLSDNSLTMTLNSVALEQVSATAVLLRGLAETYVNPATAKIVGSNGAEKWFETTQLSEILATTRVPGAKVDELKSYPESNHAVIWANGHVFRIDILDSTRSPIGSSTLASQIRQILTVSRQSHIEVNVASLSTGLSRDQWALARKTYLNGNAMAMGWIESAITTIALHSSQPPRREERMRLARADTRNVYSDKTLGFSVFGDGSIAARMEHSVADGGFLALFLQVLSGHMSKLASEIIEAPETNLPSEIIFPEVREFNKISVSSAFPKTRKIFVIRQNPDVLELLRSTKMLNIAIQFAFQAALFAVFKNTIVLISEPTSVRAFRKGRCDPNYILTKESVALARALQSGASSEELLPLFVASMIVYQGLLRETKEGSAIGPGIGLLRNVLENLPDSEEKSVIMATLSAYRRPSVFFTGAPLAPFIDAVEAFVFAPNQLAFTYTGGLDKLTFSIGASGFFAQGLDAFQPVFEKCLLSLGTIATALASVESMYPSKSLQILGDYTIHKDKPAEHGAVAIHAGAGEEFGLEPHEKQLVEFILSVVTFVGLQDVAMGHSAVDVAQSCVVALENCVFFNAGKGAVLNNDDNHELEASIVDGRTGECGAVAVLKKIKNPILAAKAVKDHAEHPFLTGSAAEEFATAWGCATVSNGYFGSHGRRAQLAAVRKEILTNLHPQTVGATILDRSGHLAVASSTGGVVNKQAGRVGDTAVVGAGVFADQDVAVACSGQGDAFLRKSIASKIAFQRELTTMQHILDGSDPTDWCHWSCCHGRQKWTSPHCPDLSRILCRCWRKGEKGLG